MLSINKLINVAKDRLHKLDFHLNKSHIKNNLNNDILIDNNINVQSQFDVLLKTNISNKITIENSNQINNNNSKEYYPALFFAKYQKKPINKVFLNHLKITDKSKIFNKNEKTEFRAVLDNHLQWMSHPLLCKNKDEFNVNVVTKTTKSSSYDYYNDNKEWGKIKPHGIKESDNKIKYYTSSKIYEVPLKSPKNGDVILDISEYEHLKKEFNVKEEWVSSNWKPYFQELLLDKQNIIVISDFIKNDYTLKHIMLYKIQEQLDKGIINKETYDAYKKFILELEDVQFDKEEIYKSLKLNKDV